MKTIKEIINRNTKIFYFDDSFGRENRDHRLGVEYVDDPKEKLYTEKEYNEVINMLNNIKYLSKKLENNIISKKDFIIKLKVGLNLNKLFGDE